MLDAARLTEGKVALKLEAVDLAALLNDVASRCRLMHPNVRIEVTGAGTPLEAKVDGDQVRLILDNLLRNAVKYGGSAGNVELVLERTPSAFQIEVRDQGPGISAADLPRLFDRFFRGANAGEGHGLGLYIAASLARLHGGALSVQSELKAGSTFTQRLPFRG